MKESPPQQN